ncbi:unnamed protein product [Haemonchus placei]|uniref:DNA-directed RNA polymerase n=1 Tax=Haemonchus placei TaxID=6290 RepID=A0A0N4WCW1_HAEPC|nr:unnamed protein product [Haemonchus placei]
MSEEVRRILLHRGEGRFTSLPGNEYVRVQVIPLGIEHAIDKNLLMKSCSAISGYSERSYRERSSNEDLSRQIATNSFTDTRTRGIWAKWDYNGLVWSGASSIRAVKSLFAQNSVEEQQL